MQTQILLVVSGILTGFSCDAFSTIKYKPGGSVHFIPLTTNQPKSDTMATIVKQLQDQINLLNQQRDYDRAQTKELERRTIDNHQATIKTHADVVQLKVHVSDILLRLQKVEETLEESSLERKQINNQQTQMRKDLTVCRSVKDNVRRAVKKLDKKLSPLISKLSHQFTNLSSKFDTFRFEYRNTSEHIMERVLQNEITLKNRSAYHSKDLYTKLSAKYGMFKKSEDKKTSKNIDVLEGSGEIENDYIKMAQINEVEGSGSYILKDKNIYLQVGDFLSEIRQRDQEISSLHHLFYSMEDHMKKLEDRLTSIQLGKFMQRLQDSLVNFTQNVITLDQWKIASIGMVNSTQVNQQQIQRLMEMILNNTNHLQQLEWTVANAKTLSYQQFSLLRMHVIQLNNTVQDIKEDLLKRHQQPRTNQFLSQFPSSPQLKTLSSRVEDLALQIIYNENRISKLEIQALNGSLFECRKFNADIYQDNRLLFLERSVDRLNEDFIKMKEMTRKLDQGLYKVYITSKNNSKLIASTESHLRRVGMFLPLITEAQREALHFRLHLPRDCHEYYEQGSKRSGEYVIHPNNATQSVRVYCDMEQGVGGWTVFQNRVNGSMDFSQDWVEYENGFGQINGEYWLGNQILYLLTSQQMCSLKIEMTDIHNKLYVAEYDHFKIVDNEKYTLSVDGYHGNGTDGLGYANRMGFSTMDRDNDGSSTHCALYYMAGWWYRHCHYGNLNGRYHLGMVWYNFDEDEWIQLRKTKMKLKPKT